MATRDQKTRKQITTIERTESVSNVEEALAPYREQVAESVLTDAELDAIHRNLLAQVRCEKKSKSA